MRTELNMVWSSFQKQWIVRIERCKMDLKQIKDTVASDAYRFLRENEHLGNRIILLGLV